MGLNMGNGQTSSNGFWGTRCLGQKVQPCNQDITKHLVPKNTPQQYLNVGHPEQMLIISRAQDWFILKYLRVG